MDALAVVLLRRTGHVAVVGTGTPPADGSAWVATLEADMAGRGWLLRDDLRTAAARLPASVRVRWADWLLATVDELVGADRPMLPLYRSFPDTPRDVEAVFVRRLLTHLFAAPGAPCVLCGREHGGAPLDPCGHPVCPSCFPPEGYSGCPICGRRLAAGDTYLPIVAPPEPSTPRRASPWTDDADERVSLPELPPLPMRLLSLEADLPVAAVRMRDQLVARPSALGERDRADLEVLVRATAPGRLDWLPDVVPARETLALVVAWALHATALTPAYPETVAAAGTRWSTVTDVARTLWAYSGGDPGLVLPRADDDSPAPSTAWRPVDEPAVRVPPTRVRALPRLLRGAALARLDVAGAALAAEDLHRHPAVWKRLGERLHPFERVAAHPSAAVAFAALRGTRTPRHGALGAAIVAACARQPRHLVPTEHPDGTVSVRLRSHASLVEQALAAGDANRAAELLTERPGDLWRRLDHLLRTAGDNPAAHAAIDAALRATAGRVAPGVLAAAAAQLAGPPPPAGSRRVCSPPRRLSSPAEPRRCGPPLPSWRRPSAHARRRGRARQTRAATCRSPRTGSPPPCAPPSNGCAPARSRPRRFETHSGPVISRPPPGPPPKVPTTPRPASWAAFPVPACPAACSFPGAAS